MNDRKLISALAAKTQKELKAYRERLITADPEYIYENSYKTAILTETHRYICAFDFLDMRQYKLFLNLLEMPSALEYLYEEYIKTDVADVYYEIKRFFKYLGEKAVLDGDNK